MAGLTSQGDPDSRDERTREDEKSWTAIRKEAETNRRWFVVVWWWCLSLLGEKIDEGGRERMIEIERIMREMWGCENEEAWTWSVRVRRLKLFLNMNRYKKNQYFNLLLRFCGFRQKPQQYVNFNFFFLFSSTLLPHMATISAAYGKNRSHSIPAIKDYSTSVTFWNYHSSPSQHVAAWENSPTCKVHWRPQYNINDDRNP